MKIMLPALCLSLFGDCYGKREMPVQMTAVETFMRDPEALGRGQALFEGTCAGYCHSVEKTDFDTHFLFDCDWKYGESDQEIFDIVTIGIPNTRMLGFGSNFPGEEDDLWKIIAFLRIKQQACL